MLPQQRMPTELNGRKIEQLLDNIVAGIKTYGKDHDGLYADLDRALPLAKTLPGKSLHEAVQKLENELTVGIDF